MNSLGYSLRHEGETSLQYNPLEGEAWAVDIMLAGRRTVEQLVRDSLLHRVGNVTLPFASLQRLLALKLFALKQRKDQGMVKDLDEVIEWIRHNQIDVKSPDLIELVDKYGDRETHEKIIHACG